MTGEPALAAPDMARMSSDAEVRYRVADIAKLIENKLYGPAVI
jgi:hypothetical protein